MHCLGERTRTHRPVTHQPEQHHEARRVRSPNWSLIRAIAGPQPVQARQLNSDRVDRGLTLTHTFTFTCINQLVV